MTEKMSECSDLNGEQLAVPPAQPSPAEPGAGPAWKVEQLPRLQEAVSVHREPGSSYITRNFVLVSPKRERALSEFAAELKRLCDRYHLNLAASPDGDFMEVIERGFRYPDGYEFSATMRNQRKIHIERTWFDEVRAE